MKYINLLSRLALAAIFVLAGLNKLGSVEMTQGYIASVGLPEFLIYPTIIFEVGVGLALIVGYQTKYAALLLAGFSLVTAAIFHANLSDQIQFVMFMKNVAISGGLLLLFEHGAGLYSLDAKFAKIDG